MRKSKSNNVIVERTSDLFFTITIIPRFNKHKDKKKLCEGIIRILHEYLLEVQFIGDMYVEATSMNNPHFHGIGTVAVPDNIKFKIDYIIRKLNEYEVFGFSKIEALKNEEQCKAYISKDSERSKEIFDEHLVWTEDEPTSTRIREKERIDKLFMGTDEETDDPEKQDNYYSCA